MNFELILKIYIVSALFMEQVDSDSLRFRRGSPLLIGVRSEHKLSTDHIPILYRTGKDKKGSCGLSRVDSTTCLFPVEEKAVEYYFASDAR